MSSKLKCVNVIMKSIGRKDAKEVAELRKRIAKK